MKKKLKSEKKLRAATLGHQPDTVAIVKRSPSKSKSLKSEHTCNQSVRGENYSFCGLIGADTLIPAKWTSVTATEI